MITFKESLEFKFVDIRGVSCLITSEPPNRYRQYKNIAGKWEYDKDISNLCTTGPSELDNIKKLILKETSEPSNSCLTCKFFNSWQSIHEDELEDFESGLCGFPHKGKIESHVSSLTTCNKHDEQANRQNSTKN